MFKYLNDATEKPVAWSKYTAKTLWTDSHISKQMLTYHLNPEINAASRSFDFIDESVDWLVSEKNLNSSSCVIDFGCGPGLYTERFKRYGLGTVVGIDFSENSLNYAKSQAEKSNLMIEYHLGNYLEYSDIRQFDLITLVMCDYCALSPMQRSMLLSKFKQLLKPDGVIAFDVFTEARFSQQVESIGLHKNHMAGFWSENDYWCIHSSYGYQTEMVWLDKYLIIQENNEWSVYNWLQHFNIDMLTNELAHHQLKIVSAFDDLRGTTLSGNDELGLLVTHA